MTDSSSIYMSSGSNIYVDGGIISGAYIYGDGSHLINIPASGVTGLQLNQITSGSATASISPDGLRINVDTSITGNLVVDGIITAKQFDVTYVSSSVMYTSGSTKFGDTSDDTHQFTGSVFVSGSINIVSGSLSIDGVSFSAMTSGTSGTSFYWQGDYFSGTTYHLNDVVYYNGSSYISIYEGHDNHIPSSTPIRWSPIALAGTSGSNGTDGSSGSDGTSGSNGTDGTSGSNGTDGTSGSNGTDGSSGSNGTDLMVPTVLVAQTVLTEPTELVVLVELQVFQVLMEQMVLQVLVVQMVHLVVTEQMVLQEQVV
jgi:hypothetical protein